MLAVRLAEVEAGVGHTLLEEKTLKLVLLVAAEPSESLVGR